MKTQRPLTKTIPLIKKKCNYIEKLRTDSYSKSESTDAYNKMVQIDSSFVEGLTIAKDDLIGILKNYTSEVSGVIFGKDENGNDIIDEGF